MGGAKTDCPLCGMRLRETYRVGGEPLGTCDGCGSITVMTQFSPEELAAHYEDEAARDYREDYGRPAGDGHVWRARMRFLERLGRWAHPGAALDVGASYGAFARVAEAAGWRVTAAELTEDGRRALREFLPADRVFRTLDAVPASRHFELITLFDVVEHLADPVAVLRDARARLAPNGLLFFTTVSVDSVNQRLFGEHWKYFRPPRHLVHFSDRGIEALLSGAGLRPVYRRSRFMPHAFWEGTDRKRGRTPREAPGLLRRSVGFGLRLALDRLGGGDILDVAARPA